MAILTNADEGIVAGRHYNFIYKATNRVGDSLLSTVLTVPVADAPGVSAVPQLVEHTETSIKISWADTADT